jgi:putative DNA primase/helicase
MIAAGGELAIHFGIVPWKEGSVLCASEQLFGCWLDGRGGLEAAEVRNMIAQVRRLIERYGSSRFDPLGGGERPAPDRLGWYRGEEEERVWLIPPETWRTTFAEGYDPTTVARVLHKRGMLERGPDGFAKVMKIQGRSERVYTLTAKITAGADHG